MFNNNTKKESPSSRYFFTFNFFFISTWSIDTGIRAQETILKFSKKSSNNFSSKNDEQPDRTGLVLTQINKYAEMEGDVEPCSTPFTHLWIRITFIFIR
jgi:hypothetical protein